MSLLPARVLSTLKLMFLIVYDAVILKAPLCIAAWQECTGWCACRVRPEWRKMRVITELANKWGSSDVARGVGVAWTTGSSLRFVILQRYVEHHKLHHWLVLISSKTRRWACDIFQVKEGKVQRFSSNSLGPGPLSEKKIIMRMIIWANRYIYWALVKVELYKTSSGRSHAGMQPANEFLAHHPDAYNVAG